jgi:hypothetical protein
MGVVGLFFGKFSKVGWEFGLHRSLSIPFAYMIF